MTQLHLLSGATQFSDHFLDTFLVDGTQTVMRHAQLDEFLFALNPEPMRVQVGFEAAAGPIVGVGNGVSDHGLLAGDLADFGHDAISWERANYPGGPIFGGANDTSGREQEQQTALFYRLAAVICVFLREQKCSRKAATPARRRLYLIIINIL
tara:strand:+ start:3894 stop:4352 length:459 start_codon:yes stop_codon:yes gene_type:complete